MDERDLMPRWRRGARRTQRKSLSRRMGTLRQEQSTVTREIDSVELCTGKEVKIGRNKMNGGSHVRD